MKPQLSIIIVNWNGENFLPNCLRSIAENPPSVPYEVIVADNNSSDKSQEWLASDQAKNIFPNGVFKYVQTGKNIGFGMANNLVVKQTGAPYVFVLNPDTIVTKNALDNLLLVFESHKEMNIGAVVPRLLNADGTVQTSVRQFPMTAMRVLIEGLEIYRILPSNVLSHRYFGRHWNHDERISVPMAIGAAIMCSREAYSQIGGFDPRFHMFGEDADFCERIRKSGRTIMFEPLAEIFHIGGESTKQRWNITERSLKELEGSIQYQKMSLRRFAAIRFLGSRIFIFLLRRTCRKILRREQSPYLDGAIDLHRNALWSMLGGYKRVSRLEK